MKATALDCAQCGFEFPDAMPPERTRLAWGQLSDIALSFAAAISLLVAVGCLVVSTCFLVAFVLTFRLEYLWSALAGPFEALFAFALYTVFARVQNIE